MSDHDPTVNAQGVPDVHEISSVSHSVSSGSRWVVAAFSSASVVVSPESLGVQKSPRDPP